MQLPDGFFAEWNNAAEKIEFSRDERQMIRKASSENKEMMEFNIKLSHLCNAFLQVINRREMRLTDDEATAMFLQVLTDNFLVTTPLEEIQKLLDFLGIKLSLTLHGNFYRGQLHMGGYFSCTWKRS